MSALPTVRIPDGIYKITNFVYPGFAADLLDGGKFGPITTYRQLKDASETQQWALRNIDKNLGGTEFILESVATRGTFAAAPVQAKGTGLAASINPTIWVPVQVSEGVYEIRTSDNGYHWALSRDAEFAPIVLQPANEPYVPGRSSKWKFQPIDQ